MATQTKDTKAVRELELCLELSTEILLESTQSDSETPSRNDLNRRLNDKLETFLRNNAAEYASNSSILGQRLLLNGFFVSNLTYVLEYQSGNMMDVSKGEPSQGGEASEFRMSRIKEGQAILDLLRSDDLYKKLLEDAEKKYDSLTEEEKDITKGRLVNIQEQLLQVSQNIINGGAEGSSANVAWFVRISKYVKEYVAITQKTPSIDKADSTKFRTLVLYLYLKAKNDKPESDFTGRTELYKYIASIVGAKPNAAKEYILSLGREELKYTNTEHFKNMVNAIKKEFAHTSPAIKKKVEKLIDGIPRRKSE